MECSAAEEVIIAEHLDVFAANGFRLTLDAEQPVGSRVKVEAFPFSKQTTFGDDGKAEAVLCIPPEACSSSSTDTLTRPPPLGSACALHLDRYPRTGILAHRLSRQGPPASQAAQHVRQPGLSQRHHDRHSPVPVHHAARGAAAVAARPALELSARVRVQLLNI